MRYYKIPRDMRADQVSQEVFGTINYTQEIIRLNQGISAQAILKEGQVIDLPKEKKPEAKGVHLW